MRFPILSLALIAAAVAAPQPLSGQGLPAPIGCYRFSITGGLFSWFTYEPWSHTFSEHSSQLIEFTERSLGTRGAFMLRAPGMRDTTAQREFAESVWGRVASDSIALTWGDGHAGLTLRLQVRGDSLVGTASGFSDMLRGAAQAEIRGDSLVLLSDSLMIVGSVNEGSEIHPADRPRPVAARKVPCPSAPPWGGAT